MYMHWALTFENLCQGQGMPLLQQHSMCSGVSSMGAERASALPSSLSSAVAMLSEKARPPLHAIPDSLQACNSRKFSLQ
jgi:hypothetical protein